MVSLKKAVNVNYHVVRPAAENAQIEVLDFLHKQKVDLLAKVISDGACWNGHESGHVSVLEWTKTRNLLTVHDRSIRGTTWAERDTFIC